MSTRYIKQALCQISNSLLCRNVFSFLFQFQKDRKGRLIRACEVMIKCTSYYACTFVLSHANHNTLIILEVLIVLPL
jgi:hypothetical protein